MKQKLTCIFVVIAGFIVTAQNNPGLREKAVVYFEAFNSKNKMNGLVVKSFPTAGDAKKIFIKDADALQFMKLIEATEKKMKEAPVREDVVYPAVEVKTFTIKDINENKASYNLGLLTILDKFKPGVRFYSVQLVSDNFIEGGFSYIYWMYINNRWIYISKPDLAFRK
jgi:hypothetical protein